MPAWLITDAEDDALQGLSLEAQVIYLRVIRRHMDYATGVAQASYGSCKRAMEFIPDRGSRKPARRVADVSNDEVKAAVSELERAGAVERMPKRSRFEVPLFRCLLARTGSVRPNEEPPMNPKEGTPRDALDVALDSAGGTPNEPQGMNPKSSGVQDLQQRHTRAGARGFPMSEAWTPRRERLLMLLKAQNVIASSVTEGEFAELLGEFRSHWMTRDEVNTQDRWEHKLASQVRRFVVRKKAGGSNGVSESRRGRKSGADILAEGCREAFEQG